MFDYAALLAILAVAGGAIATTRVYLGQAWRYLEQLAVKTVKLQGPASTVMEPYLRQHFTVSKHRTPVLDGEYRYFSNKSKLLFLLYERIPGQTKASQVHWCGWKPMLVSFSKFDHPMGYSTWETVLRFPRGLFDIEAMLLAAAKEHDACNENKGLRHGVCRRHSVIMLGAAEQKGGDVFSRAQSVDAAPPTGSIGSRTHDWHNWVRRIRLLNYKAEELTEHTERQSLRKLILSEEAQQVVADLEWFLSNEAFYKQRNIPYRRGWGLMGPPGTGKTSLARAIAEDFDLPLLVFDLASLTNAEMIKHWQGALSSTPCMVLLEDIDAVFDGRNNIAADKSFMSSHLTFDCLLQCLDGVRRNDGLIVIVTSNHPEKLDSALLRAGRIDRTVTLPPMDDSAKRELASRILQDVDVDIEELISECGENESPARFQERCIAAAFTRLATGEVFPERRASQQSLVLDTEREDVDASGVQGKARHGCAGICDASRL